MPEISRFYGIVVRMYKEAGGKHHLPHIHVEYQGIDAVFGLDGELLEGGFPLVQKRLVVAWIEIHKEELWSDWDSLQRGGTVTKIEPLR